MAASNLITITDKAIKKLLEIKGSEQKMLRVAVVGGGCSGLSYKMDWDDMREKDYVLTFNTITVVVDPKSALFLRGMQLDYSDGLNDGGFKWNNPLATKVCGCGSSFST